MGIGAALIISALSSAYAAKQSKTKLPTPTPAAPPPTPQAEDVMESYKRMRRRRGRADTILTGDLVPEDIGKKTLLG